LGANPKQATPPFELPKEGDPQASIAVQAVLRGMHNYPVDD